MASPFLTNLERRKWLLGVDQHDDALLAFAYHLDDLCRHALEMTGRELDPRHAAVIALQLVAAKEADEGLPDAPAVAVPKQYLRAA